MMNVVYVTAVVLRMHAGMDQLSVLLLTVLQSQIPQQLLVLLM
jgi:hypothetical protein